MSTNSMAASVQRAKTIVKSTIKKTAEIGGFGGGKKSKVMGSEDKSDLGFPSSSSASRHGKILELLGRRPAKPTAPILLPGQKDSTGNADGKSPTLGDRFFALPTELQLEIVNLLFFCDLLNLRKTSRKFRQLTIDHEGHIVRKHIVALRPNIITKLYPPPTHIPPTLQYLTDLLYKKRVSAELAAHLTNQIVKEMIATRRDGMTKRIVEFVQYQLQVTMAPLILALFHFLETYREKKLARLEGYENDSIAILNPLSQEENIELQADILSKYPDRLLLKVHQMYHLLLHLFFRRLTPPPNPLTNIFFGRWNTNLPPNESFAKVLVLGGIGEVCKLYRIKGCSRRRRALEKYVKKVNAERFRRHGGKGLQDRGSVSGSVKTRVGSVVTSMLGANMMGKSEDRNGDIAGTVPWPSSSSSDVPPLTIQKLARLDVDELMHVWTPAAEERLLSREIVGSLDEVSCCGQFVLQLLSKEPYEDYGEDDDDDEDPDDSGDETLVAEAEADGSGDESAWEDEVEGVESDGEE
ncbi:hypothetical protein RUND412_008211 [Rhizina undulata]